MNRVALFGLSANPPGVHHVDIVRMLAKAFDAVRVIPCGPRPATDKPTTNDVGPVHRAALSELAFRDIPHVTVDTSDLENDTFTRTHDLVQYYRHEGEVSVVVGADLVEGGRTGASKIEREWAHGRELWNTAHFAIIARQGYELDEKDMPPHARLFIPEIFGASTGIRERVFEHKPIDGLVVPAVRDYIERHGLYRGSERPAFTQLFSGDPRIKVYADPWNPRAQEFKEMLAPMIDERHPNVIAVLGGDGTMLRAVRQHWPLRLPFVGINLGTKGFMLNNVTQEEMTRAFFTGDFDLCHSPLLDVEVETAIGKREHLFGFNDAWVRIEGPGCAWVEVRIDEKVVFPRVIGDGVILSTAAGSTGYAWSAGAMPFKIGHPRLLLVGNNVMEPRGWRPTTLSLDARLEFRNADVTPPPHKRPLVGCVDDHFFGQVHWMRMRVSRIAAADIAFSSAHSFEEKLRHEQLAPFSGNKD